MDELIKKAISALETSNCNEIELTDESGMKVRVVKFSPISQITYPVQYQWQYPAKPSY